MKPEDLYAWREYARTVEKLCKPNAFVVARTRKIVHKARGDTSINRIIESRCSAKHYEVVTLSRADKRKFRSEDTIDLHGHSRDVDRSLKVFCSRCIYNGVRCATVITGKGSGTVKQATLHWLRRNPGFIVGFFEITDSAGESGAIGVILRFLGKMDLGFM